MSPSRTSASSPTTARSSTGSSGRRPSATSSIGSRTSATNSSTRPRGRARPPAERRAERDSALPDREQRLHHLVHVHGHGGQGELPLVEDGVDLLRDLALEDVEGRHPQLQSRQGSSI